MKIKNDNYLFKDLCFPQLCDASPDPILITNNKAEIYYVNPAWEKMTGYKFSEIKGQNPKFLQSGKTKKPIFTKMWRTLIAGKSFITDETIDRKKMERNTKLTLLFSQLKKEIKIFFMSRFNMRSPNKCFWKGKKQNFFLWPAMN